MKLIKLSQGYFAKVDDEDFEELSKYKWYAHLASHSRNVYAKRKITVNGKSIDIRMHRQILGAPTGSEVDHVNGDGIDNQKHNIRICSRVENSRNRQKQKNSSSLFIGVGKQCKKFTAKIWSNGKTMNLGVFETEIEAAKAYDYEAFKLRGKFARLNFPTASKPEGKE